MIEAEVRAARERAMVLEEPVAKKPRAVSEQTPVSQMVVEVLQREEERQVVEPAEEQKLQQAAEHRPEKERGDEGGRAAEVADEAKRAAEVTAAGADVEHQQEEVKREMSVIDVVKIKEPEEVVVLEVVKQEVSVIDVVKMKEPEEVVVFEVVKKEMSVIDAVKMKATSNKIK